MKLISCEKLEKSMVELQFSIDAETFKSAVNTAFKREGKKYAIPGFRKGKAPKAMIEKMYGKDLFQYDAINDLFPENYEAAVKEGVTASPAELALHNAALLEDWLPTPTERPWRRLATEKRWAPDWNEEISRVGARLEAAGEKQRVRLKRQIEALGVELREQIDALAARGGAQDDR